MSSAAPASGQAPAAPAAQGGPARKESVRTPRDELSFTDRIFLAIENPVLRRELLTSLRSHKAFVLQFLYLAILIVIVWRTWPTEAVQARSDLARTLFRIFGLCQLVLLSIMSPAFSSSAMTTEKEKRCMDLLLTSPIRPGTILIGKYMSSVTYLLLLILSTAPVMTVIMWLGGLGPLDIAGAYTLLLSVAICFGMIGLTCSVYFHRSQSSLSITYMIVLPLALILFVMGAGIEGFFILDTAIWPSIALIAIAVILYRFCLARMRQPFDPVFRAAEEEDVATQTGLVLVRDRFPDNLLAPPASNDLLPDSINPIYQKEIRSEIFGRGTLFLRLIIQISMFLSIIFLAFLFLNKEFVFVDYLVIFTMLITPAFACNTFTQERERGTLDLLLTTLIRPRHIIIGKFLSCLRLSVFLTGLVGLTLFFYLFMGSPNDSLLDRLLNLGVYFLILLLTIVFEIALAMFFSLMCSSTVRSMITTYGVVLLFFGAPVAAVELIRTFTKLRQSEYFWATVTSPFDAISSVAVHGDELRNAAENATVWPYYVGFCAIVSLALMAFVFVNFERRSLRASNTK